MGGSDPPFLYDAPQHRQTAYPYSDFDPRAATRASRQAAFDASKPIAPRNGPLIDFNKHPDSYMIVTGSEVNHDPMPKNTKKWIAAMRWVQFTLRVFGLLGALGTLVCVICLKPTDGTQGWLIRIPPAYDSVVTLYAIYHLIRPAKVRTPASSASYHFFALLMDAALIPFYVFTAIFANQNYYMSPDAQERWTSFFPNSQQTTLLLFCAYTISMTVGGLHLISIALDLYLIIIFRKIARLPPDMNPLEDNLTSRKSKHKYKNSELSLLGEVQEKKPGFYSSSTLGGSTLNMSESRLSTAIEKDRESRQIAFGHSRMDSNMAFSPHNPQSARLSRQQYDDHRLYQQSRSARNSAQNISRPGSIPPSNRGSAMLPDRPTASRPNSYLSVPPRTGTASPSKASRTTANGNQQKDQPANNNWYVFDDSDDIADTQRQSAREEGFVHQPLGMNPPTPPFTQTQQEQTSSYPDPAHEHEHDHRPALGEVAVNRTLTITSETPSSVYSESAPELQGKTRTPKSKYYGDLAAATRGVRGQGGYAQLPQGESPKGAYPSPGRSPAVSPERRGNDRRGENGRGYGQRGGRVVSRTGADVVDERSLFVPEKSSRRRVVSGKMAEEGMVGMWY